MLENRLALVTLMVSSRVFFKLAESLNVIEDSGLNTQPGCPWMHIHT